MEGERLKIGSWLITCPDGNVRAHNGSSLLPFDPGAIQTVIFAPAHGIATLAQVQDFPTFRTTRWLESWRIFELFEVILVRPIVDIHFGLEVIPAFLAGLPVAGMSFVEVMAAQCVAVMVSVTTIAGIGKQDIVLFVVTDPIAAALGLRQVFGLAA